MRWRGQRQSDNVEDRRGVRVGGRAALGGGGILLIIVLASVTGQDPGALLDAIVAPQVFVDAAPGGCRWS